MTTVQPAVEAVKAAYGYDTGDHLLREVAGRLRLGLRGDDPLGLHGGDQFLLLLADLPAALAAEITERVAEDLLAALGPACMVTDQQVHLGASIGISVTSTAPDTTDQLLQQADAAMYTAERSAGHFWSRHTSTS